AETADEQSLRDEDRMDARRTRPHDAQHGDVGAALGDRQRERGEDVGRGDADQQSDEQRNQPPFEGERSEERTIRFLPV
ncbi:hypothetical protein OFP26_41210, partial [Escherichia coli]|nr:hypothetical protein [Escherichia coli]